jgi:hypothetical protein
MKRSNLLVFDDYVHGAFGEAAITSQQFNQALAKTDQLAIQAVVDNISGIVAAGFMVKVFHSTDGRNWIARSLAAFPSVDIDLSSTLLAAGSYFGYDSGKSPRSAFVQLRIMMPLGVGAHVRVHVTGRDWGR